MKARKWRIWKKMGAGQEEKAINKQPNQSSLQPSTSTETRPLSPNVNLATANPFNPLDLFASPSPQPKSRSRYRSRTPHSHNHFPHSSRISNPHLSPPPSVDRILTRNQAKEALPNIENKIKSEKEDKQGSKGWSSSKRNGSRNTKTYGYLPREENSEQWEKPTKGKGIVYAM